MQKQTWHVYLVADIMRNMRGEIVVKQLVQPSVVDRRFNLGNLKK